MKLIYLVCSLALLTLACANKHSEQQKQMPPNLATNQSISAEEKKFEQQTETTVSNSVAFSELEEEKFKNTKEENFDKAKKDSKKVSKAQTKVEVQEKPTISQEKINKELLVEEPVTSAEVITPKKALKQIPNHQIWDALLQQNVSNAGKVNYVGFKQELGKLKAYLTELSEKTPQADWSRNEKIAYWINVYNAFTIKLIVDNYPLKSITDLHNGKPWDVKWIKLGNNTYSLNNVENDILRPKYKDARIHFAVNCAAKSCPPLLNKAWTADRLKPYFNQQAIAFINNPQFNQLGNNSVKISKIFEWYAVDFENILDYLNQYAKIDIATDATIEYLEYDWALNE